MLSRHLVERGEDEPMKLGDLVKFSCKEPRDIGVVVRIYDKHPDLEQSIDVLWNDGVWTQDAEDLEVVNESG